MSKIISMRSVQTGLREHRGDYGIDGALTAPFHPLTPAAIWRGLENMPDISITPNGENFLSAILIYPRGELLAQRDAFARRAQSLPFVPPIIQRDLPFLPKTAVVAYRKDLQTAISIRADGMKLHNHCGQRRAFDEPLFAPAAIWNQLWKVEYNAGSIAGSIHEEFQTAVLITLNKRAADCCLMGVFPRDVQLLHLIGILYIGSC
jgi:hypothetical protein